MVFFLNQTKFGLKLHFPIDKNGTKWIPFGAKSIAKLDTHEEDFFSNIKSIYEIGFIIGKTYHLLKTGKNYQF